MALKRARLEGNVWSKLQQTASTGAGSAAVFAECQDHAAHAGKELRSYLIKAFAAGRFTAEDVGTISHWHTCAGGVGLQDLAVKPERSSGHAAHLELVLSREYRSHDLYYAQVPIYDKYSCKRVWSSIPLPSEAIARDFSESNASQAEAASDSVWGQAFAEHPVVTQSRTSQLPDSLVRPISLYWDGVKYSTRDNFMGFYAQDLRSGERHLLVIIRVALTATSTVSREHEEIFINQPPHPKTCPRSGSSSNAGQGTLDI